MERMHASASLYEMQIPYSVDQLMAATVDVIKSNGLAQAYIRPIAFYDAHTLDVWPRECPVSVAIAGFPKGAYLGAGVSQGVRVMISSVRRFDNRAIPAQGKSCGQYVNSVRAVQEAQRGGYDEAIFLNQKGDVAEGSGENLFLVRNGGIVTNDASADILMGITRASILELARASGIDVQVAPISVDDLRSADELFFTGTAVEVTPIREVDGAPVADGKPGPVTTRLQQAFFDIVHGRNAAYHRWLTFTERAVVA
jgi:branched-chain amino acid aminotransferase